MEAVGWIASPIISELFKMCSTYLSFYASKKLRQLGPKVVLLERAIEVFQKIPDRAPLEQMFVDLKCAFYEAEDILDDVEYHCLEKKIQDGKFKYNGGASPRRRDWLQKKVQPAWLSFPLKNKVKFKYDAGASPRKRDWLKERVQPAWLISHLEDKAKFKNDGGASPRKRDWLKKKFQDTSLISPLKNKETGMSKKNLKASLEKIEEIINNACGFLERLNLSSLSNGNGSQPVPVNSGVAATTSVPPLVVIGRDKDCDKIIAMFHENKGVPNTNSAVCYSVIGIHGIGGSGKSTLAQLVYAREKKSKQEKRDGHFELIMWVHVSQSFTVSAILGDIFEAATRDPCPQLNNLSVLHDKLEEKLYGKRFLLVLDDVWCNIKDDRQKRELQQILCPLKAGRAGSKILVTSRTKDALLVLGAAKPRCIPISNLDDDVFFDLLMHYALEGTIIDDCARTRLKAIGADIAKKLKASPLVARIVGGRLGRRPNAEFWTTVKNGMLVDGTMEALWWSYHHLDQQARRCFAYCSIFPRRHRLYRDELVNLWVAEGFVRSTNEEEEMEDVGQEYFDELASTSFIQLGGMDYSDKEYYVVHDLLHDLAETVAGSDCFRIENGSRLRIDLWRGKGQIREGWRGDVPPDVRHLFVQNYDQELITEKILQLENLRTLIIYAVGELVPVEEEVLDSIFKRLPKLRVLAIALSQEHHALIKEPDVLSLPESISQLRHLRYLAFRTSMRCRVILPSTLTKLYQIQLLDFGQCEESEFVGDDLINLRHLFSCSKVNISNILRLTSLQTVPFFTVSEEPGYEINQLRDLNKLHGRLWIDGLGNVKSKAEALEANLSAKERLTMLTLEWDDDTECNPEVEAEVLEGLCPPVGLETLEIFHYNGLAYPNWMVGKQKNGPKYLREIWFDGWSQLGPAPDLEAFVHLHSLRVWNCSWDALPGNMEHLMLLKKLEIHKCFNISSLPTLPQSLEEVKLVDCNREFMESCQKVGHPNWQKIKHIPMKKWEFV
ncbi:unnamed protein product [Alopecurus aequalis]